MELTARQEVLVKALQRTLGITEKKSTLPMVSAVLLEAEAPGTLRVLATDLEVSLIGEYPAEVKVPGRVAVAARQAADIVRAIPAETLSLRKTENNWVEITGGRSEFKLVGLAPEEFPTIAPPHRIPRSEISAETFRALMERTLFSVCTDETRYNLMGVYIEPSTPGKLRFISSDGHRLSLAERPLGEGESFSVADGLIIPRKGLIEAKKILDGEAGRCEIGFEEKTFVFRHGDVTLLMRPIEAKFPDYTAVIPKSHKRTARLPRTAFLDALRRVALLAVDKANTVRLDFRPGLLEISATTPQLGEAREELEAQLEGDPVKVGFNARYLVDALQVLPSDVVRFELGDDASPGVLKPDLDDSFLSVIMPIRI